MRLEPRSRMDTPSSVAALAIAGRDEDEAGFDLVVADASWSWTERLFSPLADQGVRVLRLKACDWRTALVQRRPWRDWLGPSRRVGSDLWERTFVLPPGWMKTYPRLGMRPIARAVRDWRRALPGRRPLVLAISYPHYLYLRDLVRPDALIYYNMDDYALYWQARAETIRRLERRAVAEADLSVFCRQVRAEELAETVPEARDRIVHLPHGAPGQRDRVGAALSARTAAARPGGLAPAEARLRRVAGGSDRLAPGRANGAGFSRRLGRPDRSRARRGDRPIVVWCLSERHRQAERPPARLAFAGGDRAVHVGVRRLPDPVPGGSPVQSRCLPDEGDGLHGHEPAGRLDRPARVPTLRAPLPDRRESHRLRGRDPLHRRSRQRRRPCPRPLGHRLRSDLGADLCEPPASLPRAMGRPVGGCAGDFNRLSENTPSP